MLTKRIFVLGLGLAWAIGLACIGLVYYLTYHPRPVEPVEVNGDPNAPLLQAGQTVKIMTWNIQYLAGKARQFFYEGGPDRRPSRDQIDTALKAVAKTIMDEDPDIICLQEVDDGSKRTDYQDQLALLLSLLPAAYSQHASAFYHKARFVPERHILGPVGMKLCTISRYRIHSAVRYQLPLFPSGLIAQQFYFKRAVLEVRLPIAGGKDLVVLNTHLDAWTQGTDVSRQQVSFIANFLDRLDQQGLPWCLAGDLNILPPGPARSRLSAQYQAEYSEQSELDLLYRRYQAVPSLAQANGPDYADWFTYWPNGQPDPDRTLDYIFLSSQLLLGPHRVIQRPRGSKDYLQASDHFPIVTQLHLHVH
ncbi:MAG: endonuclease/exonuclease/phosphatase family protein [Sedimentisphaerales bacterium]|nr:endonuclease/exonuclease/phosphatase family protein [Sedimentisphaerales bacterium]